jgi:diguanylate cyclase (GGDEF)-like protein
MFDLAPVSLWLEDYSGLRGLFDTWRREGVNDLRSHLQSDIRRVKACSEQIRVLKVNRKTLTLFEAKDLDHLIGSLGSIFRDDMLDTHVEELVQLWQGEREFFNHSVNYSLSGRRIDIQMTGRILPGYESGWERVLVAIEDVTERENARRRQAASEQYARGLFEHSPVSLWVEDFSAIKMLLDDVREQGIVDFRVFTDVHPEFVHRCMSEIRVLDVNRQTLELFASPSKRALLHRLGEVFRDDMHAHFREQLIDLWNGKLFQQREVLNYALGGSEVHVLLQLSVLPGHERDWSLVQVALTDITARKKAEAYLEYLGKHDVLTKLYNRSFYVDELNRIERNGFRPVSVVMVDLNGLKAANDAWGHAVGDGLLRRVGEVLNKAVEKPCHAARIGGDEFALLLPVIDERGAEAVVENVKKLVELNNQFYPGMPLCLSMGAATSRTGERLEDVIKRADLRMLRAKRAHYAEAEANRMRAEDAARKVG